MKVRELIQDLLLADPDAEVLISSDSEGNSIKPMYGGDPYSLGYWDGEELLLLANPDADDEIGEPFNAIVLWPV